MVALAAPLPRDISETITDLETIDGQANILTETMAAWDGSGSGALAILSAISTLQSSIETGTSGALDEFTASSAESQTIFDYIMGTLGPDFFATLNELVSRYTDIKGISANSNVLKYLDGLKSDVNDYGAALIRNL